MGGRKKTLSERADELDGDPRLGQGFAWRFLKIAAGEFSTASEIHENEEVLVEELGGNASALMTEFLYHHTACAGFRNHPFEKQPPDNLTPMMLQLVNPFWSFRRGAFNLRGAADGSHAHPSSRGSHVVPATQSVGTGNRSLSEHV